MHLDGMRHVGVGLIRGKSLMELAVRDARLSKLRVAVRGLF
jgi:hypothetical protein